MIALVFIGDIKYCPYLRLYTDILDKEKKNYEVLYWARSGKIGKDHKMIAYNSYSDLGNSKLKKVIDFIGYRKWLLKKMKERHYSKLIILSTLSGIIICDYLLLNFKNKYIFDIRDYSYEKNILFKKIEKKVIDNSFITGISSKGFLNFLPITNKYYSIHNYNNDFKEYDRQFEKATERINIVWLGNVRYFEHQKQLIDQLSNDKRFNLIYHGTGIDLEKYVNYVKKNNIQNVFFTGEYDNERKIELLTNADIINNSYMDYANPMETQYAISNKFYDGIFGQIPQLVEDGSFKTTLVKDNKIGFISDFDEPNYPDKLYKEYHNLNKDEFVRNSRKIAEIVLEENDYYKSKILKFIEDRM